MALENVRAVSEASIQAISRGVRGGGSGGRGRAGGRRGGRGHTPAPVRSCEVKDESGNFQL